MKRLGERHWWELAGKKKKQGRRGSQETTWKTRSPLLGSEWI